METFGDIPASHVMDDDGNKTVRFGVRTSRKQRQVAGEALRRSEPYCRRYKIEWTKRRAIAQPVAHSVLPYFGARELAAPDHHQEATEAVA